VIRHTGLSDFHHKVDFSYGTYFARNNRVTKEKEVQSKAKIEHVFRVLKRRFGFDRVRSRGLAKNHNRLCACFALVNLYNRRKRLLCAEAVVCRRGREMAS